MERPFESITKTFFNSLEKVRENQKTNFANSEKFMIWIVGFAIGGISIIASKSTSLNNNFTYCSIKTILCLLSITIIFGIIYRWAFYMYQIQYQKIEFYLQGAFSKSNMLETEPRNLENISDLKEIIRVLKIDFNQDCSNAIIGFENHNLTKQNEIINELKEYYRKLGIRTKKEYEFTMNYIKDVYSSAFGISKNKIERIFNQKTSKYLKIYGTMTLFSFLLSVTSFITVILILAIGY